MIDVVKNLILYRERMQESALVFANGVPDTPLLGAELKMFISALKELIEGAESHGFTTTANNARMLHVQALASTNKGEIQALLKNVERSYRADCWERKVFVLDKTREENFDLGPPLSIRQSLPSVVWELREGNTCFSLDRWTASAFHYMRAVDMAMKTLHLTLGASVGRGIGLKHQEWHNTIQQIQARYNDIETGANAWKQPSLKNARDYFKTLIAEMHRFKDNKDSRNSIMHASDPLNQQEADGLRIRVLDFLDTLATRCNELMSAGALFDPALFVS